MNKSGSKGSQDRVTERFLTLVLNCLVESSLLAGGQQIFLAWLQSPVSNAARISDHGPLPLIIYRCLLLLFILSDQRDIYSVERKESNNQ